MTTEHTTRVYEPPLPENVVAELLLFWQDLFQTEYEPFRDILVGEEVRQNQDVFYVAMRGERIVATCHLTVARSNPELGGLGEVATAPECRGLGMASELCIRAREEFRGSGGLALFLGTINPAAIRVYHRLGWRKLAGANLMVWVAKGRSPEAFLVDDFREGGEATVLAGTAADRVAMIPLIVSPHDWQVMDANVGIFSTRYVVQNSCMGLYPRYARLASQGRGAWFAARTERGRTVGLSSARLTASEDCQIDAFTHHDYSHCWVSLVEAAVAWAASRQVRCCWARVSNEDELKASRLESLGFRRVRGDEPFELDGRQVDSIRLERTI